MIAWVLSLNHCPSVLDMYYILGQITSISVLKPFGVIMTESRVKLAYEFDIWGPLTLFFTVRSHPYILNLFTSFSTCQKSLCNTLCYTYSTATVFTAFSSTLFLRVTTVPIMAQDPFEATTATFLSWLTGKGVQISPKINIHDFRKEGKGRGVSMYPTVSPAKYCGREADLSSLCCRPTRRWDSL